MTASRTAKRSRRAWNIAIELAERASRSARTSQVAAGSSTAHSHHGGTITGMDDCDGLRLLLLPHAVAMHLLRPDKAPGIAHAIALAEDHAAGCDPCPHWLEPIAGVLPRPPYWQIVDEPHPAFSSSAPIRHVLDVLALARLGDDALCMYVKLAHRHEVAHDDTIDLITSLLVNDPPPPSPADTDA